MKNEKKLEESVATGRRKKAVASVRLRPGKGEVDVNGRGLTEYFPLELQRKKVTAPLLVLELEGRYDMVVRVRGGGLDGQAEAVRLGVARALEQENEEHRAPLKALGYLTRDPRKRERKKYGQAGARKRFQFSKR